MLEALPAFLGAADEAVAKEAQKLFAKQGLAIQTGVVIGKVDVGSKDVTVTYTTSDGKAVKACTTLAVTSPSPGTEMPVISIGSSSTSVSLARTSYRTVPESSSTLGAVSEFATGGSSTQVTFTDTVAMSPPLIL